MPELLAVEDVERWGARAADEVQRRENERAGHTLCGNCNGTGNELYSMHRTCSECGGDGIAVKWGKLTRLDRWWAECREERRRKRIARECRPPRDWRIEVAWRLSRWFGIGQCFQAREECRRCGVWASDIDYEVRRVRPFVIECLDRQMCDEMASEAPAGRKGSQ